MAPEHPSRLQRRILVWLADEERCTRGTMSVSHQELVRVLAHDKGNLFRMRDETLAGLWPRLALQTDLQALSAAVNGLASAPGGTCG